ncbi:MAG: hypothetical protein FJX88_06190 [Bacteroidetes bacterium]|nr:hypothetical protein [Bacteroidota bacterium]
MVHFEFDREVLCILQEGDTLEYPSYWIPERQLAEIDNDFSECSYWILQLGGKEWIPRDMLYRLAREIQQRFPESGIDWDRTFYILDNVF